MEARRHRVPAAVHSRRPGTAVSRLTGGFYSVEPGRREGDVWPTGRLDLLPQQCVRGGRAVPDYAGKNTSTMGSGHGKTAVPGRGGLGPHEPGRPNRFFSHRATVAFRSDRRNGTGVGYG